MQVTKFRGGRALLNLPGHQTTAAIVSEVEDTRDWDKNRGSDGHLLNTVYDCIPRATLQISNCDRSIAFEIDFDTPENNLYKLETMIENLSKFKDALEEEQIRYTERREALNRKRKDKANKRRRERSS